MAFFLLVIKSAFRNRLRASLTSVGVAIAVIAFLFLRTMISAWHAGEESAAADRMVVRNKVAIIFPLPLSHLNKVKNVPGVTDVTWANWFGGMYKEPKNFFAKFAIDADSYFRVYPEIELPPEQRAAFMADRTGCIVGVQIAKQYGWKVGDQIPIGGDIYPGDWKFTVRGIYNSSSKSFDKKTLFFHWKYLDEQVPETRKNNLGVIIMRVADSRQSTQVAAAVDQAFANSPAETHTETEKAFQMSFLSMVSQVLEAINIVSIVVLLILILILGNTMAMATRERTTEYAVLRALGFRPSHVVRLVIGEGLVIAAVGVAIGAALAPAILHTFARVFAESVGGFLGELNIPSPLFIWAIVVALLGGMLAASIPAWRAGRMRLVDALRRVE